MSDLSLCSISCQENFCFSLVDLHPVLIFLLVSLTAVDLLACILVKYHNSTHTCLSCILNLKLNFPIAFMLPKIAFCEDRSDS